MLPLPITLVAGPSGCGKTTWIHEQLSASASAVYVGVGSELLIDERYLSISFPDLRIIPEPLVESSILHEQIAKGLKIYIEVGFHIDTDCLRLPFDADLCHRVVIVPRSSEAIAPHPESASWADEVVVGAPSIWVWMLRKFGDRPSLGKSLTRPASIPFGTKSRRVPTVQCIGQRESLTSWMDGRSISATWRGCPTLNTLS